MADPAAVVDAEDPVDAKAPSTAAPQRDHQFYEAAFLLSMWSILVANEGVIRFIQHGLPNDVGLFSSVNPNRFAAQFLGGIFEVIFGIFGLAVGLAGAVLGYYSKQLTLALMAVQSVLGIYVFGVFVFVTPSYDIHFLQAAYPGLSFGATQFMKVLGILTAFAFCLALQGGQFVFIARMIAYGSNEDFLKQRTGAKMRAVFWNLNLALAGLWTVILACMVISGAGAGLVPVYFAPPNVGRIPVYLLITGLVMLIWPLLGIALVMSGKLGMVRKYVFCSFLPFLWIYVNYTVGQMGFLAKAKTSAGPAAGASMHNGLVLMVCFLGPYFMRKAAQEG